MADVKMVTVDGIRYRSEDAPKASKRAEAEQAEPLTTESGGGTVEHKKRAPRATARRAEK